MTSSLLSRNHAVKSDGRPHPNHLPQERGRRIWTLGTFTQPWLRSHAGTVSPSPGGEGRGEGGQWPTASLRFKKFALAALLAGTLFTASAALKVGDPLPDLAGFKLEGTLPESLKGKVVIVDFWASWCGPCAESFPVLDELQKKYRDQGLVIVAVSVDEKAAKMETFLKKHPVSFTVVRDAGQKLVATAEPETMPTSFIIDRAGKVRFVHHGYHGTTTQKEYVAEIESLLKATP